MMQYALWYFMALKTTLGVCVISEGTMSFNAAEPSLDALIRNPNQRTPCVLVLDASGSMDSQSGSGRSRIEELNRGLQALETELKSDPVAKTRVQVAIVCVGGPAGDADVMLDWTDAMDFQAFPLVAGGQTFLGKGMQLAPAIDRAAEAGLSERRRRLYASMDYGDHRRRAE